MPGYLLHQTATVQCSHGGQASPTAPNQRVKVSNNPVALLNVPYSVSGCPNPPPNASNGPCLTAKYSTGATRVFCNQIAVLLFDSQATCSPTGVPLTTLSTQVRVKGI